MNRITTVALAAVVTGGAIAASSTTASADNSSTYSCPSPVGIDVYVTLGEPETLQGDAGTWVDYQIEVQSVSWDQDDVVTLTSAVAHTQNGSVQLIGDDAGNGSALAGHESEQVETIEQIEVNVDNGTEGTCTLSFGDPLPTVTLHPIIPPDPPVPPVPPVPVPGPQPQPSVPGSPAEPTMGQPRYAG